MFWDYLNTFGLHPILLIGLLIGVGFLAGFINTLAGGGTIISYTLLMSLGLPPVTANGTIRLGVIAQTLIASIQFKKAQLFSLKKGTLLGIYTLLGAICGAYIAIEIDKQIFSYLVGVAMLFILILLFLKPKRWIEGRQNKNIKIPSIVEFLIYFLIGLYGGFIHIGVGFFLLTALALVSGYELLEANALKIFIVLIYTPFAMSVYWYNGHLEWSLAVLTGIGNVLGGFLASGLAIKKGGGFIRWFLLIVILFYILKTFNIHQLFF